MKSMKRCLAALFTLLVAAAAVEAQFVPRKKSTSPLLSHPTAEEMKKTLFPESTGKNLEGEGVAFPEALAGHLTLVFLPSKPDQEFFFETWMPSVRRLEERFQGFRYYVVPLVSPEGPKGAAEAGWPFVASPRSILSEEEHRKAVVPLPAERRAFYQKLAIPPDDTLHVVLIGEEGEILWHTVGGRTNGKAHQLDLQASLATNDGGG